MTVEQIAKRLQNIGASPAEAGDLSEVIYLATGWAFMPAHKPSNVLLGNLRTRLEDWRAEKRKLAAEVRQDRRQWLDAGYPGVAVADPVYLSGHTPW